MGSQVRRVPSERESGYWEYECIEVMAKIDGISVRRSEGYQTFLQVLIEQRISAGFTQADVAKRLHKPQSFVSKYERGDRRLDFVEALVVSEALGLDPRHLFTRFHKKRSST